VTAVFDSFGDLRAAFLPDPRDLASAGATWLLVPPTAQGVRDDAESSLRSLGLAGEFVLAGSSRDGGFALRRSGARRRSLLYAVVGGPGDSWSRRLMSHMTEMMMHSAARNVGDALGLEYMVMCQPAYCAELAARGKLPLGTRLVENERATSAMGASMSKISIFDAVGVYGYDLVVFADVDILFLSPFDPSPPDGEHLSVLGEMSSTSHTHILPGGFTEDMLWSWMTAWGHCYSNRASAADLVPRSYELVNGGLFAFRPSPTMHGLFDEVKREMETFPDGFVEQAALNDVLHRRKAAHIIRPPQGSTVMCADTLVRKQQALARGGGDPAWLFEDLDGGPVSVVHLCGLGSEQRALLMCYGDAYYRCGEACAEAAYWECARALGITADTLVEDRSDLAVELGGPRLDPGSGEVGGRP